MAATSPDLPRISKAAGGAVAGATTEDLRGYLGALAERGFKAATVARHLSALRQLYRFLYAEGNRSDDPAAVLEGPKRGRALPKVLSIAEVDALLEAARRAGEDEAQEPAARLRAARLNCLIEVLYATGLRVSELVALPASAARRDQRMLVVRGKGGKERLVPLNEAAKRSMDEYLALARRGSATAQSKWLFPSFGEQGHLTRQHFAREFKALGRPAALRRRGCPRTCCAMPSPATCCTTAPTCAWCRRCSATPTFPPRRSTPMCWKSG